MKTKFFCGAGALVVAVMLVGETSAQQYYARHKLEVPVSGTTPTPSPSPTPTPAPTPTPTPTPPSAGNWSTGEWSAWNSTCSTSAVRVRSVVCQAGGETVPDERCNLPKPEATEVKGVYSGCTHILQNGSLYPNFDHWTVSAGTTLAHVGSSMQAAMVPVGGTVSQTTIMPLEAGQTYTLKASAQNSGNSLNRHVTNVLVTSNGTVLANRDYNQSSSIINFTFVGTGSPVTVTFTNNHASVRQRFWNFSIE